MRRITPGAEKFGRTAEDKNFKIYLPCSLRTHKRKQAIVTSVVMRRIMAFRSTTDRTYDGGSLRL